MLVLGRRYNEKIFFSVPPSDEWTEIELVVVKGYDVDVQGFPRGVRIGINAKDEVSISRDAPSTEEQRKARLELAEYKRSGQKVKERLKKLGGKDERSK